MRFSHFFIARPIFASVVSLIILIVGAIAYSTLPVSQFPDIVPPTISVTATFPGANAVTVADTVASVIEQEVNGVEGMIYMYSQSTDDGTMSLSVTFEVGHRHRQGAGAGAEPRRGGRAALARGGASQRHRRQQADRPTSCSSCTSSRRRRPTIRSTSPTTHCSTCATSLPASPELATSRCSGRANTRCESGSTRSASHCAA